MGNCLAVWSHSVRPHLSRSFVSFVELSQRTSNIPRVYSIAHSIVVYIWEIFYSSLAVSTSIPMMTTTATTPMHYKFKSLRNCCRLSRSSIWLIFLFFSRFANDSFVSRPLPIQRDSVHSEMHLTFYRNLVQSKWIECAECQSHATHSRRRPISNVNHVLIASPCTHTNPHIQLTNKMMGRHSLTIRNTDNPRNTC